MIAAFSGNSNVQFLTTRRSAARLFALSSERGRHFASLKNGTFVRGQRAFELRKKRYLQRPGMLVARSDQELQHVRFNVSRNRPGFHP
jgi:hypothetical protein